MPINISGDTYLSFVKVGTVSIPPVASFTSTPVSGNVPFNVTFTDTSTNYPTSWLWHFGDGTTSTARNPTHTYTTQGTYSPTLTATNSSGSGTGGGGSITANPAVFAASATILTGYILGNWFSSSYTNGKFVIVDYGSANSYYSSDNGSSWTLGNTGALHGIRGLSHGAYYMAGVQANNGNTNVGYYSGDGTNWYTLTLPSVQQWWGAVYGNGGYVFYGSVTGGQIALSGDLGSFSMISTGVSSAYTNAYFGNGIYMLCTYVGALVMTSNDGGQTWTRHNTPVPFYSVAYGNGVWVGTTGGISATVYTSTDNGVTWTTHINAMPTNSGWRATTYGNGVFVSVADNGGGLGNAAYSTNGVSWTLIGNMDRSGWASLIYANGTFITTCGGTELAKVI
jgi:PKD repeat protein